MNTELSKANATKRDIRSFLFSVTSETKKRLTYLLDSNFDGFGLPIDSGELAASITDYLISGKHLDIAFYVKVMNALENDERKELDYIVQKALDPMPKVYAHLKGKEFEVSMPVYDYYFDTDTRASVTLKVYNPKKLVKSLGLEDKLKTIYLNSGEFNILPKVHKVLVKRLMNHGKVAGLEVKHAYC